MFVAYDKRMNAFHLNWNLLRVDSFTPIGFYSPPLLAQINANPQHMVVFFSYLLTYRLYYLILSMMSQCRWRIKNCCCCHFHLNKSKLSSSSILTIFFPLIWIGSLCACVCLTRTYMSRVQFSVGLLLYNWKKLKRHFCVTPKNNCLIICCTMHTHINLYAPL